MEPALLRTEVARIADRLRGLSLARLAEPVGRFPSRAEAGRSVAQALADAAAASESAIRAEGAVRRDVPRLPDRAVADQVAVTGADLAAALTGAPSASSAAARTAYDLVVEVRRLL